MPLTDEEQQWLRKTLGGAAQPTTVPPPVPGTLPPDIPTGQPYPSSVQIGRMRIILPPPPSEVQRQLTIDQAKKANVPPKVVPSAQLKPIEDAQLAIARLQEAIQTFKQHHYQTGPLSFRYGRGKIGNALMQFRGQPGEEQFKTLMGRFNNAYITAQTGAQRGFKEMQWLASSIPNPELDTPENFLSNAEAALEELHSNQQQMWRILGDAGYNVKRLQSSNVPPARSVEEPLDTRKSQPSGGGESDFSTARPVEAGFDFSTAQPVESSGFHPNLQDFATSGKRYVGNLAQAVMHPIQTAQGIGNIALGGIEKLIPGQQPQEPYADALGNFIQQRYGSFDAAHQTFKHDPVGMLADASMALGGIGGITGKIGEISAIPDLVKAGGMTSRIAAAVDPMAATLNAAQFAGQIPARVLEASQRGTAAQAINSLIKPANRAFAYGRNPGLAVAKEGIVASSLEDLAAKTAARQDALGGQIGQVLSDPAVANKPLNLSDALTPLQTALTKAQQNPRTNARVIQRLENLRDDLLGVTINPDGTSTVTRDFASMSPIEAFNLKKTIGELTRWTDNPSEDNVVNAAMKQVYGGIRSRIEQAVPGIHDLNERYANLLEASTAARNQALASYRRNQVGALDVLGGVAGEMRGGVGGAMIGVLLSQGVKAALRSPYIRTQLAAWMAHATPTEMNRFFDRIPGLKSEAMRVGLLTGTGQQRVTNFQASPQTP